VQACASADRSDSWEKLRRERARIRQRIRRWQKQCDRDNQEPSGQVAGLPEQWQRRLEEIPRQIQELRQSGQPRGSRTDPESRYLRRRGGFCLGFTAELAGSGDHLIVAQRGHPETGGHGGGGGAAGRGGGGGGVRGWEGVRGSEVVQQSGVEVIVPDILAAREMTGRLGKVEMNQRQQRRHPGLKELRERLRDPVVRACYARRKALAEPVLGVLKQQRGMRQFRCRGLLKVGIESALATTPFNLTRMFERSVLAAR